MKNPKDYAGLDAERQFAQKNHQPMENVIDRKEDLQLDHDGQYKVDKEGGRIIDHVEDYEPTTSDHETPDTHEDGLELPEEDAQIIHDEEGVIPDKGEVVHEEVDVDQEKEPSRLPEDERNYPVDDRGTLFNETIVKNEQGVVVVPEPIEADKTPRF